MNESSPLTPVSRPEMIDADATIEACADNLSRLAGRASEAWPRRFYNAAAFALNQVRRAYADEMCEPVFIDLAPPVPGDAEDQNSVS